MHTGIPNWKRKFFYDLPTKVVECCRDIPWVAARVLTSDTGGILKGVLVFADYIHLSVKYLKNPNAAFSSLLIPSLNTALRTTRVILDPCFKYLHSAVQTNLSKGMPFVTAMSRQLGLILGLGSIHLGLFTYLTVNRAKKLIALYKQLKTGYIYEENKGGTVYTKDIRVKLASVGLKLATIAASFVGLGLVFSSSIGLFGLGAGALQVANLCSVGGTAVGTTSWAALLFWKHYTYNPKPPTILNTQNGTRLEPVTSTI